MGRRCPVPFVGGGGEGSTATHALGALVVGAVLLAAALFVAVTLMRGPSRADRIDPYISGPGPTLDPAVPIKAPTSWDAFYAFFRG